MSQFYLVADGNAEGTFNTVAEARTAFDARVLQPFGNSVTVEQRKIVASASMGLVVKRQLRAPRDPSLPPRTRKPKIAAAGKQTKPHGM